MITTPVPRRAAVPRIDGRGSVTVMTALWLLGILFVSAIAIDGGYWYLMRLREQKAADAAAIAGAVVLADGNTGSIADTTDGAIRAAGQDVAAANGFDSAAATTTVTYPYNGNSNQVAVLISRTAPTFLSTAFGLISQPPTVNAFAVAALAEDTADPVCILGLNGPVTIGALSVELNAKCTVASNSTSATAIEVPQALIGSFYSLYSAGGICVVVAGNCADVGSRYLLEGYPAFAPITDLIKLMLFKTQVAPAEFQPPVSNPYLPLNTLSLNLAAAPAPQSVSLPLLPLEETFQPGDYANTLTANAAVDNFQPGTYVLENGIDIQGALGANVVVNGTGVTFVVQGGAVNIGASSGLNVGVITHLSAPAVNPDNPALSGVLLDIPPSAAVDTLSLGNLNVLSVMQGAIYAPATSVALGALSLSLGISGCEVIVAKQVTIPSLALGVFPTSSTACAAAGTAMPHPYYVELVQ